MGRGKKPGDRAELLLKEEMDKLLTVVAGDLFFSTLYKILLYSGRRIGEIYGTPRGGKLVGGIKLRDVDFTNKQIKTLILKTKKRKLMLECLQCKKESSYKATFCPFCGSKMPEFDKEQLKYAIPEERYIPMREEMILALQVYLNNHKPKFKDNDFLFRKYALVTLKKKIKYHAKLAGIKKNFTLHGFRHYFATQCFKAGMSADDISKWTGHANPASLSAYNRMVPDDIRDKIESIKL